MFSKKAFFLVSKLERKCRRKKEGVFCCFWEGWAGEVWGKAEAV